MSPPDPDVCGSVPGAQLWLGAAFPLQAVSQGRRPGHRLLKDQRLLAPATPGVSLWSCPVHTQKAWVDSVGASLLGAGLHSS